jgi:hypothetical protein
MVPDVNYPWLMYSLYAGEGTYATVYKVRRCRLDLLRHLISMLYLGPVQNNK